MFCFTVLRDCPRKFSAQQIRCVIRLLHLRLVDFSTVLGVCSFNSSFVKLFVMCSSELFGGVIMLVFCHTFARGAFMKAWLMSS